ncbi:MAG TPA: response regulator [Ktedonobacterales bacterium]
MSHPPGPHLSDVDQSAPTILVIEDDAWILRLTTMLLREAKYRCVPARDIDAGWQALQRGAVDLIVSDLRLDALSLIERVRAHPQFGRIPIIIASGETKPDVIRTVLAAGAARYLTKPYAPDELLASIRQCLASETA